MLQPSRVEAECGKEPEPNTVEIFKDCDTNKMKGMNTHVKAIVVSPYSLCLLNFDDALQWL